MKKFLTSLCVLCLAFVLAFSGAGCFNFIKDNGSINDIPNANVVSSNVTFGTLYNSVNDQDRQELKLKDAVSLVKRSSAAIYMESSAASGVLVDFADGTLGATDDFIYVITCFHVIEKKGIINLYLPDEDYSYTNLDYVYGGVIGQSLQQPIIFESGSNVTVDNAVTLIGGDKQSDIAVLKLDISKKAASGVTHTISDFVTSKLPPQDYTVVEGEEVFAIGNPTGLLPGSVCAGIVSKVKSEATFDDIGTMQLMQIDATINPGNSGGGLYNLYGELIGITNGGNTSYEAINFAIPMHAEYDGYQNGFVDVAKQLIGSYNALNANGFINYGYVQNRREAMGFTVVKRLLGNDEYVIVQGVSAGSQASNNGLKPNDNIIAVQVEKEDGSYETKEFTKYDEFTDIMDGLKLSGKKFKLVVSRLGDFVSYQVIVGDNQPFAYRQYIFCDTGVYK